MLWASENDRNVLSPSIVLCLVLRTETSEKSMAAKKRIKLKDRLFIVH